MKTAEQLREAIHREYSDLAGYGGPLLQSFVRLLSAMYEEALADLATVQLDKLERKQGALSQLRVLHDALKDPGPHATLRA
jgi:hypothetical protein